MQIPAITEASAGAPANASTEEAGPASDADEEVGEGTGQHEEYASSWEEGGMALTGRDPRLTLLWEWQCPLPPTPSLHESHAWPGTRFGPFTSSHLLAYPHLQHWPELVSQHELSVGLTQSPG